VAPTPWALKKVVRKCYGKENSDLTAATFATGVNALNRR
jgi:hypothetical protein